MKLQQPKYFHAAKKAGAVGVCLSGAGPCLIAFSTLKIILRLKYVAHIF